MPIKRHKFVFVPSTDTQDSRLLQLRGEDLAVRDRLISKTLELLGINATEAKAKESAALSRLTTDLPKARDKHTALWAYEKAHLAAGEDWDAAKTKLRNYQDPVGTQRILVTDFMGSFEEFNRGTAQIEGVVDPRKRTTVKLGTAFLGDARFVDLRPQPRGLLNTVYVLGRIQNDKLVQDPNHTDAHFVWLPNSETYVRRFVTRGLNHTDLINIMAGRDLCAPVLDNLAKRREIKLKKRDQSTRHPVREGAALSEEQRNSEPHPRMAKTLHLDRRLEPASVLDARLPIHESLWDGGDRPCEGGPEFGV